VAEAVAGPNWGSTFTPRIGSEVLVDFIDIDRPLVVACLDNGSVQDLTLSTRQGHLKAIAANAASSFM